MSDKAGIWPVDGERIAKTLARAGVCSRRDAERLIEDGRVSVNGKLLDSPAFKVTPKDKIKVDGQLIEPAERTRMWRYHKPQGLVTTHRDPQDRPTVFERLPDTLPRVISVGRLDLNSEGLLLLTNDGELARALELPATGWVRRYRARAFGRVTQEELDQLRDGIVVDGIRYGEIVAKLEHDASSNVWIAVSLTEGKNREVRRVFEAIGLKVNRLIRVGYGPFQLGKLEPGEVEEIGPRILREQLGSMIKAPPERAGQAAARERREGKAGANKVASSGGTAVPVASSAGASAAKPKTSKGPRKAKLTKGAGKPGAPKAASKGTVKDGGRTTRRVR